MGEPEITFTQFPNSVLEPLMFARLSAREFNIMLYVVRMTFGYRKEYVKVSLSELSELIGMERANVSRAINKLCQTGWLSKISASGNKSQMLCVGEMFNKYSAPKAVDNCEDLPLSHTTTVVAENNTSVVAENNTELSSTTTESCRTEQQRVVAENNTTLYLNKKNFKENFKYNFKESKKKQKSAVRNGRSSKCESVKHINKKSYGQNHNVTMTEAEHSQLIKEYGEDNVRRFITRMDNWIKAKGRAPNDCCSELRVWLDREDKALDPEIEKYKVTINRF